MNFKEFHNLDNIRKHDEQDKNEGIKISVTPEQLPQTVQLGTTFEQVLNSISELFPNLEDEMKIDLANEFMSNNPSKTNLEEFVSNKQASLKVETLDASATNKEEKDSFVPKVATPKVTLSTKNLDEAKDKENDEKEDAFEK